MSRGIGSRKELVVARIGSGTRWLPHAMVAARDVCREEIVVARKCLSRGVGCREELVVARNWLSRGIGCREELVVARNW